jgi:hypothetical protein
MTPGLPGLLGRTPSEEPDPVAVSKSPEPDSVIVEFWIDVTVSGLLNALTVME